MRDDLLTILERWHRHKTELREAVMVARRRRRLSRIEALDLLDDLLEDIEDTGCRRSPLTSCASCASSLCSASASSAMRRVAASASPGLRNFRWHDFRHSCASFLAQNGASLLEIGHMLGHRTKATTLRYAHLVDAKPITGHAGLEAKLRDAK
jgi:integrase